jgi:hypothetical protein
LGTGWRPQLKNNGSRVEIALSGKTLGSFLIEWPFWVGQFHPVEKNERVLQAILIGVWPFFIEISQILSYELLFKNLEQIINNNNLENRRSCHGD